MCCSRPEALQASLTTLFHDPPMAGTRERLLRGMLLKPQAHRRASGAGLQEQPPHGGLVQLAQRRDRRDRRRHGFGTQCGVPGRLCNEIGQATWCMH